MRAVWGIMILKPLYERKCNMKPGVLWTIGAFVAGAAVGVTAASTLKMCSDLTDECCGRYGRSHKKIKFGDVSPVDDMNKMSSDVHDMVAEVVSHECGHLE
jgi:hypothetical protein